MADNTTLNPGTGGDVIATEDISGVKIQRVKMAIGAVDSDDGDVSVGNPLPVSGTFFQSIQPVNGTVNVGNFPASQSVTGTINVGNFPTSTNIGNFPATQTINGIVTANSPNASNFLATISGTVAATQSGTWNVGLTNNPITVAQSNASNFLATIGGTVTANQSNASNLLTTASQGGSNWTIDNEKIVGTTIDVNSGTKSAGTQRVVIATDQPQLTNKLLVTPDSNIPFDLARVQGQASVASVAGVLDVMPRKRTASTGLSPNYISGRINTSTTTTIVNATCYLSSLHMTCSSTGAAWAMKVQDGQATARVLVPNFVLNVNFSLAGLAFSNPVMIDYPEPILCTSGINVVTVGGSAGNIDYFATYWQ